tara:strand:- start:1307 stop:1867 length:561 start_codon:yes stop_codon:yes gene_type:complete
MTHYIPNNIEDLKTKNEDLTKRLEIAEKNLKIASEKFNDLQKKQDIIFKLIMSSNGVTSIFSNYYLNQQNGFLRKNQFPYNRNIYDLELRKNASDVKKKTEDKLKTARLDRGREINEVWNKKPVAASKNVILEIIKIEEKFYKETSRINNNKRKKLSCIEDTQNKRLKARRDERGDDRRIVGVSLI